MEKPAPLVWNDSLITGVPEIDEQHHILVHILNEAGGLPTRNFTSGQFAAHDKISGETMHATITARGGNPTHGCHAGCQIQC